MILLLCVMFDHAYIVADPGFYTSQSVEWLVPQMGGVSESAIPLPRQKFGILLEIVNFCGIVIRPCYMHRYAIVFYSIL